MSRKAKYIDKNVPGPGTYITEKKTDSTKKKDGFTFGKATNLVSHIVILSQIIRRTAVYHKLNKID